jgi:hypothetical protein
MRAGFGSSEDVASGGTRSLRRDVFSFIYCIGHCYAYANYEPASGQFRVRVRPGSPIAAPTPDDTEALENGIYVVQPPDLPMTEIYQCDEQDLSKLCRRDLTAGEKNGRLGHQAPTF